MLHEKVGKHGTRNRGRYQVPQSWLNRLYRQSLETLPVTTSSIKRLDSIISNNNAFFAQILLHSS